MTRLSQTKIVPPALWNACDYIIHFNFINAHIPGAQNTAADYLYRLEADPKDKIVLKMREDVQTLPMRSMSNQQGSHWKNKFSIRMMTMKQKSKFGRGKKQFDEILPQQKQQ